MSTSLPTELIAARQLMASAMIPLIETLDPVVREVVAYHIGLTNSDGQPIDQSHVGLGKGIRPGLALLSARAAGGSEQDGTIPAVAVEFVHTFSLLHDDIMDGAAERRGRPAAWRVYGIGPALLAGDALMVLSQGSLLADQALCGTEAARCLTQAMQRLVTGQSNDMAFELRSDVGLAECVMMARHKTAALISCACSIGAVYLGAPPSLVSALADFGEHAGLAFQLTDDLMDIWGSPDATGKSAFADLRAKKKTLPVVAALTLGREPARELRHYLANDCDFGEANLAKVADLVEEAGGRTWAETEVRRQLDLAERSLAAAEIAEDVRSQFVDIANFISVREW